jgi:hypothetical protein
MSNVIDFPTPREQSGVSMKEDMYNLLDCLMGAMMGIQHSENVSAEDRKADMEIMTEMFIKYLTICGERYPEEDEEE